jgi:beta-glucuronidase
VGDWHAPRRLLPVIQDGWNIKGLISSQGDKKLAVQVLKDFYAQKAQATAAP